MFSKQDVPYATAFTATFNGSDVRVPFTVKAAIDAKTRIHITRIVVSTSTAMTVEFQDNTTPTANTLVDKLYMGTNDTQELTYPKENPLTVTANKAFEVLASIAGSVTVNIAGYTD